MRSRGARCGLSERRDGCGSVGFQGCKLILAACRHLARTSPVCAADAHAVLLGLQLDHRPRTAFRYPADGDDLLSLAFRDRDPHPVRVAAYQARLAHRARQLAGACRAGRDRGRHAQWLRLSRPQLHDRDQWRDPQLVHPDHDRRAVVGVPAGTARQGTGRRRGDLAGGRVRDPDAGFVGKAARLSTQRRRLLTSSCRWRCGRCTRSACAGVPPGCT